MVSLRATRRTVLHLTGLGVLGLAGCQQGGDGGGGDGGDGGSDGDGQSGAGGYRPGAVEVRNDDDASHDVTVTLSRFEPAVWTERGGTPSFSDPEVPTAEPAARRRFEFAVGAGETAVEADAITDPLCGPVTLVEVALAGGSRVTTHVRSECGASAPEDRSNVYLQVVVTGADGVDLLLYTRPPD